MKQALRTLLLTKRLKQLPEKKKINDEKIVAQIKSLPEFQNANQILFYIPIQGEVDLTKIFAEYNDKKDFVLPRVIYSTKDLNLYKINKMDDLEKGSYEIPEPKNDLKIIAPEDIDLVLLPGVGFSLDGHRIGYGEGFFDRLLKKIPSPKIGIAYEFQIVKNVPAEEHDVPVDMIITEDRIIKI